MLESLVWISVIGSVILSTVRALNIGYQKESYILCSILYVPLIWNAIKMGTVQLVLLEMFHTVIAMYGAYRWIKPKQKLESIHVLSIIFGLIPMSIFAIYTSTTYLDTVLWFSFFSSICTSLLRAVNVGYQKESYLISSISHIPLIYNAYLGGAMQLVLLETFHALIAFIGFYRYLTKKVEIKKD